MPRVRKYLAFQIYRADMEIVGDIPDILDTIAAAGGSLARWSETEVTAPGKAERRLSA